MRDYIFYDKEPKMKLYDLRSDTITKPSEGMRKAMYNAEVGDDVFGEDPTVNRLQELCLEIAGKEASLFVSSGSMGNLIPIFILCGRGNEVLVHEKAHILHYELSSVSSISGSMPVPVPGERGILKPDALVSHLRHKVYYVSEVRLVCIENTHNLAGGTCYSINEINAVCDFAENNDLCVHIDGARIFNAHVATGVTVKKMAEKADSLTFCLSKGLGAPVGSVLCGDKDFIDEARKVRKLLGGGMRQSGVLAAAGIYALQNNISKIKKDHEHAKKLAEVLNNTEWADVPEIDTNIIIFNVTPGKSHEIADKLKAEGMLCIPMSDSNIRIVTSLEISDDDTEEICNIIHKLTV